MKTKYEIELPTLPEGFEFVGYVLPKKGDRYLSDGSWNVEAQFDFENDRCLVARRKRTLADWANEQPLFKALAEMRCGQKATQLIHHHGTCWSVTSPDSIGGVITINAADPTENQSCKLTLKNGKWDDAT